MIHLLHLKKGFTLVELLVVISIMGVLVSLGLYGFQTSLSRSRDERRKSDLMLVQGALENYKSDDVDGSYPDTSATGTAGYTELATFLVPNFLTTLPQDPLQSNGGSGTGPGASGSGYSYTPICVFNASSKTTICKSYTLSATLERAGESFVINQNGEVNPTGQLQCTAAGSACTVNSDCCSNSCSNSVCASGGAGIGL